MKPSKEQAKGTLHEKGKIKEPVGKITPGVAMEKHEREEKIAGKVQKNVGKAGKK